jgi:uncharacterized membrane protein
MSKLSDYGIPAGLIVLSIVPILAGSVRLSQLASGVVTEENARFFGAPAPAVFHMVTVTLFSLLGALQFAPRIRNAYPKWHRWAGRIIVPSGIIAALTGLWMNQFYALPPHDGTVLYLTRLTVGIWMAYALSRGYLAIRRWDIAAHQNWMLRGYAIGMGAGTQVLTSVPYFILVGEPGIGARAVMMGAGWAINAVVAEMIIWRRERPAAFAAA